MDEIKCLARISSVAAVLVGLVLASGWVWAGENAPAPARWRLELQGVGADVDNNSDRNGAYWLTGSLEYEKPVGQRGALGLRLLPLFLYPGEDNYGAGVGLAGRLYQKKEERTGLYGELALSALWTKDKFEDNSSRLNFLNEIGVGYQFPENWHVAVKFEHISNAGLGRENAGINGIGIGVGYSF